MKKKPITVEEQREARKLRLAKKKKKSFWKSKILWVTVGILLILLGINYLYHIEVLPIYPPAQTVHYTPGHTYNGIYLKDTYFLTTSDGVKAVDIKGYETDVAASVSPFVKAMKEPVYDSSNNTVLVYDALGTSALLFDESGIITPFSFDGRISCAKMNHKGDIVVVVNEEGSKAAVKVFDCYGNERYTWYSGTGYVVDAAINPDNDMMAVLTNDISDTGVTAKVLFFRMDNPEPVKGQVISNRVGASVSYYGNETFVICANGLYLLKDDGSLSLVADTTNRNLQLFSYFSDGAALLCFQGDSVDTYLCEVYDRQGKQMSQFNLNAFVQIGDIADDKFVVHTKKEFFNVTRQGKIMKSGMMDYDIQNVSYFQNRVAVIGQDRMTLQ